MTDISTRIVLNGYWARRTEVFARSFEAWVSWKMAQQVGKSKYQYRYENSFLCKPLKHYLTYNVYPHDFKALDPLFTEFCRLSGRVMNGKRLSEPTKKVADMPIPKKKKPTRAKK